MSEQSSSTAASELNAIEQLIASRSTAKVLLPVEKRSEQERRWQPEHTAALQSMLEAASWAPFHKKAHESTHRAGALNAPMPWRFHMVGGEGCTQLLSFLQQQAESAPDSRWSIAWQSKIKEMIAGCGVLIQATWLPDPSNTEAPDVDDQPASTDSIATLPDPQMSMNNSEHIAAAASAIENLLLAAASRQWLAYWSSGGILRDAEVFDHLGISRQERLLGAVFLTPEAHPDARIISGGLRDQRGSLDGWVRWI